MISTPTKNRNAELPCKNASSSELPSPEEIQAADTLIAGHQVQLEIPQEMPLERDLIVVQAMQDVDRYAEAVRVKQEQIVAKILSDLQHRLIHSHRVRTAGAQPQLIDEQPRAELLLDL